MLLPCFLRIPRTAQEKPDLDQVVAHCVEDPKDLIELKRTENNSVEINSLNCKIKLII